MFYKKIAHICLLFPCFLYADDSIGYLVNKGLAKDPAIDYGIGNVKGPVKRLIIWKPVGKIIFSYDKDGKITVVDNEGRGQHTEIYYGLRSNLPIFSMERTNGSKDPIRTLYNRDNDGNIMNISTTYFKDGKIEKETSRTWFYKKLPDGVVEVSFGYSPIMGDRKVYYKNGLPIKEVSENAQGINSKLESVVIPRDETLYKYQFHKDGVKPSFISQEIFNAAGNLNFRSWEKFSIKGDLLASYISSLANPHIGTSKEYIDYKFDKYSNWTERRECVIDNKSKKSIKCNIQERTISYY